MCEIVCPDEDGRSNFHKLLFRREWPFFYAFDPLGIEGQDLRDLPLIERKRRRLRAIVPKIESRLLCQTQNLMPSLGCFPGHWVSQ